MKDELIIFTAAVNDIKARSARYEDEANEARTTAEKFEKLARSAGMDEAAIILCEYMADLRQAK